MMHEYSNDTIVHSIMAKSHPRKTLIVHSIEAGQTAYTLLEKGVFSVTAKRLASELHLSLNDVYKTIAYFVSLHDIGKCEPVFQSKICEPEFLDFLVSKGYAFKEYNSHRHESMTLKILKRIYKDTATNDNKLECIFQALSLHHQGKKIDILTYAEMKKWEPFQDIIESEMKKLFKPNSISLKDSNVDVTCSLILGITILSDWIASGDIFENVEYTDIDSIRVVVAKKLSLFILNGGLSNFEFPQIDSFSELWKNISYEQMRPIQRSIEKCFSVDGEFPLAVIIEAPMGEGKTEAGLYAAFKLMKHYGKAGIYMGLPSAISANQVYDRFNELLENNGMEKARLLHSKAWYNDVFFGLKKANMINLDDDAQYAIEWTKPLRRGLLAPFAVGTVDQIMMSVLLVKYGILRLLGLQNKVLIIDEIHAYDTYMSTIIQKLLCWCKALEIPVVMMSATLPRNKKEELVKVYYEELKKEESEEFNHYPMITKIYSGKEPELVKVDKSFMNYTLRVKVIKSLGDISAVANKAMDLSENGGCICVIVNLVAEAQDIFEIISSNSTSDMKVLLFHSRFTLSRKKDIEDKCIDWFGKNKSNRPKKAILVATQIVEQSLDLDFDVMISSIAPIDLLIQRSGRVHRHSDTIRPIEHSKPVIYVFDGECYGKNAKVYDELLLARTSKVLNTIEQISVPKDMRSIIENVYSIEKDISDPKKKIEYMVKQSSLEGSAKNVEIPDPDPKLFSMYIYYVLRKKMSDETKDRVTTRYGESNCKILVLPNELYWQLKTESYIELGDVLRYLNYQIEVAYSVIEPYLTLAMTNGEICFESRGYLKGNYAFCQIDGKCSFVNKAFFLIDDDFGLRIVKGGMDNEI